MSLNLPQAGNDDPLRAVLRDVLRAAVESPRATGGIGSVECRAVVTLYSLLMDHPVDQWGRCRSCRRPGSVVGSRWRRCQVHGKATLCLRQLDEVLLLSLLADELESLDGEAVMIESSVGFWVVVSFCGFGCQAARCA
jgi:hypothetical protein